MKCITLTILTLALLALSANMALAQSQTRQPRTRGAQTSTHPLIGLLDVDGDGVLSEQEIEKAAAKLKSFDTSKDGKLTSKELQGKVRLGPSPVATPIENGPLPNSDAENKVLTALKQMRKGPRYANVSTNDGRLLRMLAEAIGAKYVVEIGTSTGESATWIALALRSTGGKLFTHELDPRRAKVARENFKMAGVDDLITVIEGDAHETVKQHKEPIDILFLDADKSGYIDYLEKLAPLIRPGGLIIAHNMRYPKPDPNYLKAITEDPKFETSFLLMEGAGLGVTLKKR